MVQSMAFPVHLDLTVVLQMAKIKTKGHRDRPRMEMEDNLGEDNRRMEMVSEGILLEVLQVNDKVYKINKYTRKIL